MTERELEYYIQKRREGWDNSEVRKSLKKKGFDKADISYFIHNIDDAYVKTIIEKSDLTVNNLTTRILESVVGTIVLAIGLFLLYTCVKFGPGLFTLIFGTVLTSFGYYFSSKGWKGLLAICKNTKRRAILNQKSDLLDD